MEPLEVQDFPTAAGIVRRSTTRKGVLYEAFLYREVHTSQEVMGLILRTVDQAQAKMAARQLADEQRFACAAALVAALEKSELAGPGRQCQIDEVATYYAADPDVMAALQALEEARQARAAVEDVKVVLPYERCWADEYGPVETVGVGHAIGQGGATYTLGKGGVWKKDKGV